MLRCLIIVLFVGISNFAKAQYEIKGNVNLSPDWQQQIFLSTINKLDDYYNANPEDIIQVATINPDGSFLLKGDKLPDEKRFYRLYMIKEEGSEFDACLFVGGDDHNFIHLILDNNTKIDIQSDPNYFSPFGNYKSIGDNQNSGLEELTKIIYPSFYFYQIKFPSELQFSQEKHNRDMFAFADTCQSPLVGLAALINTDFDKYYPLEKDYYQAFAERLNCQLKDHSYTADYARKLRYYEDPMANDVIPSWVFILIASLFGLLLLSLWKIRELSKRLSSKTSEKTEDIKVHLTQQERKILKLIIAEKSNKEIASELFIELSTVKTHINKLYAKLKVNNRSDAIIAGKTRLNAGV